MPSRPEIAVLADDLTGATDTGVQFSKQGLRTLVVPDLAALAAPEPGTQVLVVSSHSRHVGPAEAAARAGRAARQLHALSVPRLYKKVDSLLRGNLGAELDAAIEAFGADMVVVAPAFPANGRITVGGFQLAHGVPVSATEARHDPFTPVDESHLPRLLARQSRHRIGHLDLDTVSRGVDAVAQAVALGRRRGERVVVADAATPEHLAAIAAALPLAGADRLCAGTAGLAEWLPAAFGLRPAGAPIMVVVGSRSGVARRQLALLLDEADVALVRLDPLARAAGNRPAGSGEVAAAVAALGASRDVAVTTELSELAAGDAGRAEAVQATLGGFVAAVMRQLGPGRRPGLVLTGGDTALAACRSLGLAALATGDEVAPGLPAMEVVGGPLAGLRLVTKAGAFGADTALLDAVRHLKRATLSRGKGAQP